MPVKVLMDGQMQCPGRKVETSQCQMNGLSAEARKLEWSKRKGLASLGRLSTAELIPGRAQTRPLEADQGRTWKSTFVCLNVRRAYI